MTATFEREQAHMKAKERAGYHCEICQMSITNGLLVDYLDGNQDNLSDDNLMAFCMRCYLKRRALQPPAKTREKVFLRMPTGGRQLPFKLEAAGRSHSL